MLQTLFLLIALQLVGEVIARGAGLPIPGPVIGMVLLFLLLLVRDHLRKPPPDVFFETADRLLAHLSLLFVPAGVGVIVLLPTMAEDGLPIAAALLVSTILAVAVTAWVMRLAIGRKRHDGTGPIDDA